MALMSSECMDCRGEGGGMGCGGNVCLRSSVSKNNLQKKILWLTPC